MIPRICAILLLAAALPGCRTPTEIVLYLDAPSGIPATMRVKLHRSTPFNENPTTLPSFVQPALDGADLVLDVTPQGEHTTLSLLPGQGTPLDLSIAVSSPGYDVDPAKQDSNFVEGVSTEIHFTFSPLPTGDMAHPADMARPADGGAPKG
jgi:hypothetical protein